MGISPPSHAAIVRNLDSPQWSVVVDAVASASVWMSEAPPGDAGIDMLAAAMEPLAKHSKWEVRRALAHAVEKPNTVACDRVLGILVRDVNARVREAAESSSVRRKDRRRASVLDDKHAERVIALLDELELSHGLNARRAAQRAADDIGCTYARELYHEVVKLLAPLALSAARIRGELHSPVSATVERELDRIDGDVRRIRSVLHAMRDYSYVPSLSFRREEIGDVIAEAIRIARASSDGRVQLHVDAPSSVIAEVDRRRLIQAIGNLASNALEAYPSESHALPVRVAATAHDGYVIVAIEDRGAGMSPRAQADARLLFASTKAAGTGFGLPLAIQIIESEHNGRLSIASCVGRGTTVTVTLPMKQR